jgi:hypothetical protein
MNSINLLKGHILGQSQWDLDESSFEVLNESKGSWVARASTTHLAKRGEPEVSFTIVAQGMQYVLLDDSELSVLLEYLKSKRRAWHEQGQQKEDNNHQKSSEHKASNVVPAKDTYT